MSDHEEYDDDDLPEDDCDHPSEEFDVIEGTARCTYCGDARCLHGEELKDRLEAAAEHDQAEYDRLTEIERENGNV